MVKYVLNVEKVGLIREGLSKNDAEVQKAYAKMIEYVMDSEKGDLVREGLSKNDEEVQKICTKFIGDIPDQDEKEKLLEMMIKEGKGNILVQSVLYDKENVSKENLSRVAFDKSGSETTLIGGKLKNKTIIRHMEPGAFVTWQKLYEGYKMWNAAGFNYVPIEPIQSFKLNKKGLVDVYTSVLDLSLQEWIDMSGDFSKELEIDRNKILDVLDKADIDHGHTHRGNFCLSFFRDKDGNVDFSKKPRIYLIDFDQAKSP